MFFFFAVGFVFSVFVFLKSLFFIWTKVFGFVRNSLKKYFLVQHLKSISLCASYMILLIDNNIKLIIDVFYKLAWSDQSFY